MPSKRESRYRDFATVVYPDNENTPDNWKDILEDTHLQILISPLHDKDTDEDNKPKKAHYHVMLMYDAPHTKEQAIDIFSLVGGIGCEICKSKRGYARYLTHKDTPHKYQYDDSEVCILGGADYYEIINLISDKYALIQEILDYVAMNEIENILDLYQYVRENGLNDWFRCLCDNTFVIERFCSANYKARCYESRSSIIAKS